MTERRFYTQPGVECGRIMGLIPRCYSEFSAIVIHIFRAEGIPIPESLRVSLARSGMEECIPCILSMQQIVHVFLALSFPNKSS